MADFADLYQREFERAQRSPSARANQRAHDRLRGTGATHDSALMRTMDTLLSEREREAAREALLDAKDELARLKRENAHRDDIADAREDVAHARAELRSLT